MFEVGAAIQESSAGSSRAPNQSRSPARWILSLWISDGVRAGATLAPVMGVEARAGAAVVAGLHRCQF